MPLVSDRLLDHWRRPMPQLLLTGFVLFCSPGMFNAVNGIGAGGAAASAQSLVSKGNAALYSFFTIVGLFSGALVNKFGLRFCLSAGCLTYALYIGSLWSLARNGNQGFVIFSSCLLGIGASFLWAAQGTVVMSYPVEAKRSLYFSLQWMLFTLGCALGGLIALGQAITQNEETSVKDGTYIAFIVIILIGSASSLLFSDPLKVKRTDGTPIQIETVSDWKGEFFALGGLFKDKAVLIMLPAFLASNWFYAYHFSLNSYYFSLKGRSLNSTLYWVLQSFGAFLLTTILDMKRLTRRKRGILGLSIVSICIYVVWAGGAAFQAGFDRHDPSPHLDWTVDRAKWGRAFALYISYGFCDSLFQAYCYWLMSTRTNDPAILARLSGIYKGVQSAGAALSFGVDAAGASYMTEFSISFALVGISLPLLGIVTWWIKPTNYGMEEHVVPPKDWEAAVGHIDHLPARRDIEVGTNELSMEKDPQSREASADKSKSGDVAATVV